MCNESRLDYMYKLLCLNCVTLMHYGNRCVLLLLLCAAFNYIAKSCMLFAPLCLFSFLQLTSLDFFITCNRVYIICLIKNGLYILVILFTRTFYVNLYLLYNNCFYWSTVTFRLFNTTVPIVRAWRTSPPSLRSNGSTLV